LAPTGLKTWDTDDWKRKKMDMMRKRVEREDLQNLRRKMKD
jgi:hypothetical protein